MINKLPDLSKWIYFDTRCPAKLYNSNCYFYNKEKCSFNGVQRTCIYDTPNYKCIPLMNLGR